MFGAFGIGRLRDYWLSVVAFVCEFILVLLATTGAPAEIVIDDFDDFTQITLPQMENQSIETPHIGLLGADRFIDVSTSQTDPFGSVDVNLTRLSHLTARFDGQYLDNPANLPILSFGAGYVFHSATDLTEGGVNDTLFIDIAAFRGSGIPPALSVVIADANDAFAAIVSGFNLPSDSPYALAIPFSSFGFRGGGGVGLADFSTISLLDVRIRLLQGSRDPNTNWLVQLDRLRVGSMVPEPNTWQILALVLSASLMHGRGSVSIVPETRHGT